MQIFISELSVQADAKHGELASLIQVLRILLNSVHCKNKRGACARCAASIPNDDRSGCKCRSACDLLGWCRCVLGSGYGCGCWYRCGLGGGDDIVQTSAGGQSRPTLRACQHQLSSSFLQGGEPRCLSLPNGVVKVCHRMVNLLILHDAQRVIYRRYLRAQRRT